MRRSRRLLSAAILAYLVVVGAQAIPSRIAPAARLQRALAPALRWTGLRQSWAFFAPNPRNAQFRLDAEIVREDGVTVVWKDAPARGLDPRERDRMQDYRLRRWTYDRIIYDDYNPRLRPLLARYVAKEAARAGASPPKEVVLRRHVGKIQPPKLRGWFASVAPPQTRWRQDAFFAYAVRPEDLR